MAQKWRYVYLIAYKNDVHQVWWAEDGKSVRSGSEGTDSLPTYLEHLGSRGYELAGVTAMGETGSYKYFIFKRPDPWV